MELYLSDISEMDQAVRQILDYAGQRKKWVFTGEIGAGKTTFIQHLCRQLGVEEPVTSPTFSIINEYPYQRPDTGEKGLIRHLDLYRLRNIEEALDVGIEDILDDPHYCLIEWPEIIESLLPDKMIKINIGILDNSVRKILFL
ncbi:MAG: tRNA (adenosine(37)-N6)-threonylcarbamoyltransferase complex ATPase subunit type 1 TsaE [Bacteroidota bacterium]